MVSTDCLGLATHAWCIAKVRSTTHDMLASLPGITRKETGTYSTVMPHYKHLRSSIGKFIGKLACLIAFCFVHFQLADLCKPEGGAGRGGPGDTTHAGSRKQASVHDLLLLFAGGQACFVLLCFAG